MIYYPTHQSLQFLRPLEVFLVEPLQVPQFAVPRPFTLQLDYPVHRFLELGMEDATDVVAVLTLLARGRGGGGR
jgi:hypothetical protein